MRDQQEFDEEELNEDGEPKSWLDHALGAFGQLLKAGERAEAQRAERRASRPASGRRVKRDTIGGSSPMPAFGESAPIAKPCCKADRG